VTSVDEIKLDDDDDIVTTLYGFVLASKYDQQPQPSKYDSTYHLVPVALLI
jgi:hypothetical protein